MDLVLLGYVRAATDGEALRLQRHALVPEGCERILVDPVVPARTAGFDGLFGELHPGDTLVVCRLEVLARSLEELVDHADALRSRGVGLRSLAERIDTDAPGGDLVHGLFAALAGFARAVETFVDRPGAVSARRPFPSRSGDLIDVAAAAPRSPAWMRRAEGRSIAARKRIGTAEA